MSQGKIVMAFKHRGKRIVLDHDEYLRLPDFKKSRSLGPGEIDNEELQRWAEKQR